MSLKTSMSLIRTLIVALCAGVAAGPCVAGEGADPLAELSALDDADLAGLSGRQGISISDQDLVGITKGGSFAAGDDIETGVVHFGSSMQRMSGLNNQAINTGNDANTLANMAVHVHLH